MTGREIISILSISNYKTLRSVQLISLLCIKYLKLLEGKRIKRVLHLGGHIFPCIREHLVLLPRALHRGFSHYISKILRLEIFSQIKVLLHIILYYYILIIIIIQYTNIHAQVPQCAWDFINYYGFV